MISLTAATASERLRGVPTLLDRTPCRISKGHGSFLTFDFAETIGFRAPQIWVYCCNWQIQRFTPPQTLIETRPARGRKIFRPSPPLVHSEDSDSDIEGGLKVFDGASFDRLTLFPDTGKSLLYFSSGVSLLTWPYDDEPDGKRREQQWMISENGRTFSYRSDGLVACYGHRDIPEDGPWLSFDDLQAKSGTS